MPRRTEWLIILILLAAAWLAGTAEFACDLRTLPGMSRDQVVAEGESYAKLDELAAFLEASGRS